MKALLISPHLDDAILSAGQFLAGYPFCDVMTIFAGVPDDGFLTPYDEKLGFKSSRDAVSFRRIEDIEATSILRANHIHAEFLDSQYVPLPTAKKIAGAIEKQLAEKSYTMLLGPLGVAHPDHLRVREAIELVNTDLPIYLWEDIPNRVLHPEKVADLIKGLELEFIGTGDLYKKMASVMRYKSQIGTGDLNPNLIFVPERFWKLC